MWESFLHRRGRPVFCLSSLVLDETVGEGSGSLLLSVSMDRTIAAWDVAQRSCCWSMPSLGGARILEASRVFNCFILSFA